MNATAFPTNPLHSTNLTASLSTCGSNSCCPIGYSCQNSQCFLNNPNSATSQNNSTTSSSTGSSAAPTPISTANPTFTSASSIASISSTPTPLSGAAGSPSTSATASVHCDKFPATAIIAGFFPGLIIGILLTVLVLICLGRRKGTERMSGDFGHVRAQVSDPIYQGSSSIRTDFLRRTKSSAHVRSLFMRSPSTKFSNSSTPKTPSDQSPRTPESRIGLNAAAGPRRVPSMESIKIYSPPDGRLDQRQTTFTEMMENAGFRKGEPYLGSPGRVDPRTRHLTAGFGMK
ncbi:hypothetical protein MMC25_004775 [Agyrium rufum]|nr:hypothetical protein [Agyrium rufum]